MLLWCIMALLFMEKLETRWKTCLCMWHDISLFCSHSISETYFCPQSRGSIAWPVAGTIRAIMCSNELTLKGTQINQTGIHSLILSRSLLYPPPTPPLLLLWYNRGIWLGKGGWDMQHDGEGGGVCDLKVGWGVGQWPSAKWKQMDCHASGGNLSPSIFFCHEACELVGHEQCFSHIRHFTNRFQRPCCQQWRHLLLFNVSRRLPACEHVGKGCRSAEESD